MIVFDVMAGVLVLQALFVLHAMNSDGDGKPRSFGGIAWALALVASSIVGGFALHALAIT